LPAPPKAAKQAKVVPEKPKPADTNQQMPRRMDSGFYMLNPVL